MRIPFFVSGLAVFLITGCSAPAYLTVPVASVAGSSGTVVGGSQPVAKAIIQLYSVGTTGDGSIATPLLTKAVITDATGSFNIAGLYTCADATDVYLTATGGEPMPGIPNESLALMTALGPCLSLNPQTPIVVNELTTVAAVNALAPYITSYMAVGSGSRDVAGLNDASTLANALVNSGTGTSPGINIPSGGVVPIATIDTLGDIMAPCVNSGGGVAGDRSPCGNFFSLTTPLGGPAPSNTVAALLSLARNPGANASALYQMASLTAPFEPQLSSLPSSFAVTLGLPPSLTMPPAPPTASATAFLLLSPTSITYPPTTLGNPPGVQYATLTNGGTAPAQVSGIQIGGSGSSDFSESNDCPSILAAGAPCVIQIIFSPQGTVPPSAALTINEGQLSLPLSGAFSESSKVPAWPSALLVANPSLYVNFNDHTSSFLDQISGRTFASGGGVVTTQQPGFDNTTPNNTSAGFAWNAYSAAPDPTLGAEDWDVPWTMMVHIDRLNWNRTGSLILASKGDLGGCVGSLLCGSSGSQNSWWQLYIAMNGKASQLCFQRNGYGKAQAQQEVCTGDANNWFEGMPNGFNYNIVVEDSGTGSPEALSMYVNGLLVGGYIPGITRSNTYADGFGNVAISVSGGTGYANTTAFTSTGGGPNCVVTGFMYANGGVPYNGNWTPTGSNNYGCTSNPAIVLTSPTGTGAVITAISAPISMNASTLPILAPGYFSAGAFHGVAGTNSAASPTYVDEFALFPGNLTFSQITKIFYNTKFYQNELYPSTVSSPPLVIFEDTGCGPDFSGDETTAMVIGAAKFGLIRLLGVDVDDGNPNGINGVGWYRQMLDQAGLAEVPVSVGPNSVSQNSGGCPAANLTAYNASTPQNPALYESSTTMYRTLFAQHSMQPIYTLMTQAANGYAQFVTSPSDNISALTGLQLQAQNASNGGYTNIFEGNMSIDPTYLDTILRDNGSLPIYSLGGSPQPGGPGIEASRTVNDPLYMAAIANANDVISGWTNLNVAQVISPYFWGGVTINYRGGTGYANSTPFTSTGGGINCTVTGIMNSSGGVPNGIETYWGTPFPTSTIYNGLGYGCTSSPTIVLTAPTGTGVTLTATSGIIPNCYGISGCTGNVYTVWSNIYGMPSEGTGIAPIFQWFQNSLMDPPVD